MKIIIKLIITIVVCAVTVFLPISCGEEYLFASQSDCDSCFSSKPEFGIFQVDLSDKTLDQGVVVKVFKGKYTEKMQYDDSQIYLDTAHNTPYAVKDEVPLDEYYSVVAEYIVDGKKYSVVDGDKIRAYSIKNTCNTDCWIIRGGKADCRLHY